MIKPIKYIYMRKDQDIYSEGVITLEAVDEAGGVFLEMRQDDQKIRIDFGELQELLEAAKKLEKDFPCQT